MYSILFWYFSALYSIRTNIGRNAGNGGKKSDRSCSTEKRSIHFCLGRCCNLFKAATYGGTRISTGVGKVAPKNQEKPHKSVTYGRTVPIKTRVFDSISSYHRTNVQYSRMCSVHAQRAEGACGICSRKPDGFWAKSVSVQ